MLEERTGILCIRKNVSPWWWGRHCHHSAQILKQRTKTPAGETMTSPCPFGIAVVGWGGLEMGFLFRVLTSHNVEWQADLWTFCVLDIKRNFALSQKSFIQGINTLKAQREVSTRLVDVVEKLVSFFGSVYLDCSWFFFFKDGEIKSFCMLLLLPLQLFFLCKIGFGERFLFFLFFYDLNIPLICQYISLC